MTKRVALMRPDELNIKLTKGVEGKIPQSEYILRESIKVPEEAVTVAASLDGVMLPMKDGKRQEKREKSKAEGKRTRGPAGRQEASCGTLSFYDAQGDRLTTFRILLRGDDGAPVYSATPSPLENLFTQRRLQALNNIFIYYDVEL
jgi:hypothetical protein